MKLMLVSLSLALLAGFLLGGQLRNLSSIRLRWTGLAIVGFALQWVSGPGTELPLACLYLSFVLLTVFAVRNIRIVGFPIILVGIAMNFLVIGVNQGMPVARQALEASGQSRHARRPDRQSVPEAPSRVGRRSRRVPGRRDRRCRSRSDQAISVGDIFTYGGVGVVIVAGMRAPAARRPDEDTQERALADDPGAMQHAGG